MGEKKYYWLKLQNDFFSHKEIKKLRKIAGGDTYTVIYLKMLLVSLKNDDCLFYDGVEETFAEELAKAQVKVSVKVGEGGKVFGSVSSKEIAEAAKAQLGYDIDKKKIQMKDPIKAVGTTSVAIKLHPKVTAELKVVVKEEA